MRASVLILALFAAACASAPRPVGVSPVTAGVDVAADAATAANPPVDGVELPTDHSIAANLAAAPTLSTLVRLLAASGRMSPTATTAVTLFAPTDAAFGRLAPGTVDALLKPENRATLVRFVTLHLVAGRLSSAALVRRIDAGGGRATLTSLAGEPLMLTMTGSVVTLTDGGGNRSYVEIADVRGSDGVIHVVNGVLVPRLP